MTDQRLMPPVLRMMRLTFTGPGKEMVPITFGPRLTVISGPSDTGKSFVLRSIEYLLGASRLPQIRELEGYTDGFLSLSLPDGQVVTLGRTIGSSRVRVFEGDVLPPNLGEVALDLAAKHNPRSKRTLSQTLLSALGMWGVEVLEGSTSLKTRQFSFREISKFYIIDEQRMIAPQSPAVPTIGRNPYITTLEKSIFRFLMTGNDDAGLIARDDVDKTMSNARSELLDQIVAKIADGLKGSPGQEALETQREHLLQTIDSLSASVQTSLDERRQVISGIQQLTELIHRTEIELAEHRELYARFQLLQQQYASDLERLEMVDEAGTLLGLFRLEICPICGASAEHQHRHLAIQDTNGDWVEAVRSEIVATRLLAADLSTTTGALLQEISSLQTTMSRQRENLFALNSDVQRIENALSPELATMENLAKERSDVEHGLYAYIYLSEIESLRTPPRTVEASTAPALNFMIDDELLDALCQTVSTYLIDWGIEGGRTVRFDQDAYELIIDGRPRSTRGKGIRAITHAAFTLALCQFGLDRGIATSGFVVLDSPIVTYREADRDPSEEDEYVSETVAQRFYKSVASSFPGQAIILENIDPIEMTEGVVHIRFTNDRSYGRAGFL